MRGTIDGLVEERKEGSEKPANGPSGLWSRLTELWILIAILTFFLVRVFGSQAAHRLLGFVTRRHAS